ncbi:hypothetical protein B4147_1353 [Bacillus wiedmannii]|uniref:Uncharacterized protein n=1 Tax=Bacillus wiedmannii TaxID=1890302 RepID=A0A0G8BX22_9BACI|nr:hypothetical protein B4147_1353 [Bacillus wiedmannii]
MTGEELKYVIFMLKKYIKNLGEIGGKCLSKNLCRNVWIV